MRKLLTAAALLFLATAASAAVRISPETTLLDRPAREVAMAFGERGAMIAWTEGIDGDLRMHVAPLGNTSQPVVLPRGLTTFDGQAGSPAIASDGSNYLVVWLENFGFSFTAYGVRIDGGGRMVDPAPVALAAATVRTDPRPAPPRVLWNGSAFVFSWTGYVRRIESTAALIPVPILSEENAVSAMSMRDGRMAFADVSAAASCIFVIGLHCTLQYSVRANVFVEGAPQGTRVIASSYTPWVAIDTSVGARDVLVLYADSQSLRSTILHSNGFTAIDQPMGLVRDLRSLLAQAAGDGYFAIWNSAAPGDLRRHLFGAFLTASGMEPFELTVGGEFGTPALVPLGSDRVLVVHSRTVDGKTTLVSRTLSTTAPVRRPVTAR